MAESYYENWKKQREANAIPGYPCKDCARRERCDGAGKCSAWEEWFCEAWRTICESLRNYAK